MQSKQTLQMGPMTMTLGPTEADEAEAFASRLRNPLEHGLRVLSDGLQAGLKGLGSLLPELGWTPPEGWDKDLGKS